MKSIMFNEKYGMETATLNGSKTRTTRKFGLKLCKFDDLEGLEIEDAKIEYGIIYFSFLNKWYKAPRVNQPKYKVGEVVAIKQSYKAICDNMKKGSERFFFMLKYGNTSGWTNKMFVRADLMPHQIQITDIKLERLKNISNEDCMKEGIYKVDRDNWRKPLEPFRCGKIKETTPRKAFAALIDKISGKGTWECNDCHIVYYYKLVK